MAGVAIKLSDRKLVNPFLTGDDIVGKYKKRIEVNGKFAFSLDNRKIAKNKVDFLDKVLLIFNGSILKDDKKYLLCSIEKIFIEESPCIPDEVVPYLTELNTPSKFWFLLSDLEEVDEEFLSKCKLAYEEGYLLEILKKGSRFPVAYFRSED